MKKPKVVRDTLKKEAVELSGMQLASDSTIVKKADSTVSKKKAVVIAPKKIVKKSVQKKMVAAI